MSNEETNAFDLVNLYLKHIGLLMSLLIFQLHGALFKCTRSIGMYELACKVPLFVRTKQSSQATCIIILTKFGCSGKRILSDIAVEYKVDSNEEKN